MSPSTWRSTALACLAVAAAVAAAQAPVVLGGASFSTGDHLSYSLASRHHLAESLRALRVPEWWDRYSLGAPFASNPNHGVVYPVAWLVALVPDAIGADALLLLHLFIAGAGTVLLARRLGADPVAAAFAGATLATSGYVVTVAPNHLPLLTLAWAPWVAWAADRLALASEGPRRSLARQAVVLAMFVGLQALTAEPATFMSSTLVAGVVLVARAPRRVAALAAAGCAFGAAALLAGAMILPALWLLPDTQRAAGFGAQDAASIWSLHPLQLLELVWPSALGDSVLTPLDLARLVADTGGAAGLSATFAGSLFLGAPVLLLAAVGAGRGRGFKWLGAGSLVLLALALGRFTPVYPAYRFVALPEQMVRFPAKHFAGAVVLWSVLAGVGLSAVAHDRALAARVARAATVALVVFGLVGIAVSAGRGALEQVLVARSPLFGWPVDVGRAVAVSLGGGAAALLALAAVTALLWVLARARAARSVTLAAAALALVSVAHLALHAQHATGHVDRTLLARAPPLLELALGGARAGDLPQRLYRPPARIPFSVPAERTQQVVFESGGVNVATLFGLGAVPGGDSVWDARFERLWSSKPGMSVALFASLYDIGSVILPTELAGGTFLPAVAAANGFTLLANPERRPRAFVASCWEPVASDDEALAVLRRRGLELQCPVVHGAGPSPAEPPSEPGLCVATSSSPEETLLDCTSPRGGYAVLLDAWSPGWSAAVDGHETRIDRADQLVRAVAVGPGRHQIRFSYRTPGLRAGVALSLVAWVIAIGLWLALGPGSSPSARVSR